MLSHVAQIVTSGIELTMRSAKKAFIQIPTNPTSENYQVPTSEEEHTTHLQQQHEGMVPDIGGTTVEEQVMGLTFLKCPIGIE